ncbi:MAG TPA: choice-of-anchor Q domain-containing protein, partial [Thermoanaerobaculia bacterium]|nr:choice-of-anchor Q domain-containing protein [Thermoanaerobaculia bacterium]
LAAMLLALPARAVVITVMNANDSGAGSLRAALTIAADGDTVNFDAGLSGSTITLLSQISVGSSVAIQGLGSSHTLISGSTSRIFEIAAGKTVSISGVSFSAGTATGTAGSGSGTGGAILNHGALSIDTCAFTGNAATGGTASPGPNNGGTGAGGAIYNDAGATLSVSNSVFSGNTATGGTGGDAAFAGDGGDGVGGAIFNAATATATITGSQFNQNVASGGTGGSFNVNGGSSGFGGGGEGGAIYSGGALEVSLSVFASNEASGGTGGVGTGGDGGEALGGAILDTLSAVVGVTTSTFDSNTVAGGSAGAGGDFGGGGHGAAIGNFSQATLTLTDSTLTANHATGDCGTGGGIHNFGAGATLTNDTIQGNSASCSGGAITDVSGLTLLNCTISGNTADSGGGMDVTVEAGAVTLTNTIVAGNTATTGPDGNVFIGTVQSGGHNVIGIAFTGGFAAGSGDQIGTIGSPLDPGLNALANNGGPTQTMALTLTSPALDHGDDSKCPPTDQTTITTRPQGAACDVGAFELPVTTGTGGNAFTLSVTIVGDGSVTSAPTAGIDCPSGCSAAYFAGTSLTLTATPGTGSVFRGWSGGCTGFNPSAPVTMNSNVACTATFGPPAQVPMLGAGAFAGLALLLAVSGGLVLRRP